MLAKFGTDFQHRKNAIKNGIFNRYIYKKNDYFTFLSNRFIYSYISLYLCSIKLKVFKTIFNIMFLSLIGRVRLLQEKTYPARKWVVFSCVRQQHFN